MIAEEVKPELVKRERAHLLTKLEALKTRISSTRSEADEIRKDCEARINPDILEETLQICRVPRVMKSGVSKTYQYYYVLRYNREERKLEFIESLGNIEYASSEDKAAAWREAKARSERLLGISRTMQHISKNLQDKVDMLNLEMYLLEEGERKEDDVK